MFIRLQHKEHECDVLQNKLDQLTIKGFGQKSQNSSQDYNPYLPVKSPVVETASVSTQKNAFSSPVTTTIDQTVPVEDVVKPKSSQNSLVNTKELILGKN